MGKYWFIPMFVTNLPKKTYFILLVEVVDIVLDVDDINVVLLVEVEAVELVEVAMVVVEFVPKSKGRDVFSFECSSLIFKNFFNITCRIC